MKKKRHTVILLLFFAYSLLFLAFYWIYNGRNSKVQQVLRLVLKIKKTQRDIRLKTKIMVRRFFRTSLKDTSCDVKLISVRLVQ